MRRTQFESRVSSKDGSRFSSAGSPQTFLDLFATAPQAVSQVTR